MTGFVQTESFKACENLFNDLVNFTSPYGVVLCGGHSRGKTLSSTALLWELHQKKVKVEPCFFPELIGWMKHGIHEQDKVDSLFERIEKAYVVVVDELGAEPITGNDDHARWALYQIVKLCLNKKFLVMTTNLKKSQLPNYFKSHTESRLNPKSGYCRYIEEPYNASLRKRVG